MATFQRAGLAVCTGCETPGLCSMMRTSCPDQVDQAKEHVETDRREIHSMADLVAFMNERCESCGCFLNNAPDCDPRCAHGRGCPPDCWDLGHPNPAMRRPPER